MRPIHSANRNGIHKLVHQRPLTKKGIRELMLEISGFLKPIDLSKKSFLPVRTLMKAIERQRTQSAEVLARKKRIFVPGIKNGVSPRGKNQLTPLWGCHQECLVLYTALSKLGEKHNTNLNPRLVRKIRIVPNSTGKPIRRPHTLVFFDYQGKTYSADPFNELIKIVHKKELMEIKLGLNNSKFIDPVPLTFEEFKKEKHGTNPYSRDNAK